ncbi:MAG TPA: recombinase family protein [Verrucomicrobiae bacterium]|nr:recombinase family protein [Verrucomicrobiae bacterium]
MKKIERERQVVSSAPAAEELERRTGQGWKLVAIDWEREVEIPETASATEKAGLPAQLPFGLQVESSGGRLEENPSERELLFEMMELIVQEGSYARIAEEIIRRGFRTREGTKWTPVSVFEMLPRLIEVGPHVFQSAEWQKRRQQLNQAR